MRTTNPDKPITPFNKTQAYAEHVAPLIEELVKQCTIHGIPMFVTCATSNSAKQTHYERQVVAPDTRELNLLDDEIQHHLCIQLGFDTVYRNAVEFDHEEDGRKV